MRGDVCVGWLVPSASQPVCQNQLILQDRQEPTFCCHHQPIPFFFLIISTLEVHMLGKAPLRKKRNFKNLTLEDSPVVVQAADGSPAPTKSGKSLEEYSKFCERLSDLEIGLELRLDLRSEDFSELDELGRGNGGTVCKVLHVRTKTIMAKKVRWTNRRRSEHLRAEPA
jgi:hypothetical protein